MAPLRMERRFSMHLFRERQKAFSWNRQGEGKLHRTCFGFLCMVLKIDFMVKLTKKVLDIMGAFVYFIIAISLRAVEIKGTDSVA